MIKTALLVMIAHNKEIDTYDIFPVNKPMDFSLTRISSSFFSKFIFSIEV